MFTYMCSYIVTTSRNSNLNKRFKSNHCLIRYYIDKIDNLILNYSHSLYIESVNFNHLINKYDLLYCSYQSVLKSLF